MEALSPPLPPIFRNRMYQYKDCSLETAILPDQQHVLVWKTLISRYGADCGASGRNENRQTGELSIFQSTLHVRFVETDETFVGENKFRKVSPKQIQSY